jgi:hypothetical protein
MLVSGAWLDGQHVKKVALWPMAWGLGPMAWGLGPEQNHCGELGCDPLSDSCTRVQACAPHATARCCCPMPRTNHQRVHPLPVTFSPHHNHQHNEHERRAERAPH